MSDYDLPPLVAYTPPKIRWWVGPSVMACGAVAGYLIATAIGG